MKPYHLGLTQVLAPLPPPAHCRSAPLAIGVDDLGGNHANTHIPEVIGDARGWELTGNATKQAIATNFFALLTNGHTFSTGGECVCVCVCVCVDGLPCIQ